LLIKFEGSRVIEVNQIEQQFWIYPEDYALDFFPSYWRIQWW